MTALSTLDLQNNNIAQVPPQLGNVTQLRCSESPRNSYFLFSITFTGNVLIHDKHLGDNILIVSSLCQAVCEDERGCGVGGER